MLITFLYLFSIAASVVFGAAFWGLFLKVGLRWVKVPYAAGRQIIRATCIVHAIVITLSIAVLLVAIPTNELHPAYLLVVIVGGLVVPIVVIKATFQTSFRQTLKVWLLTILGPVIPNLLLALVVKQFLFESFTAPTNSMAPTLLGVHWQGNCEICGTPAFGSPQPYLRPGTESLLMICADHFHVNEPQVYSQVDAQPDRFVVCKLLSVRRWDLVTFQLPSDPTVLYVKRLIGLPGEEIVIRNGAVWVNGKELIPPEHLLELRYESEMESWPFEVWGSEAHPARLAKDEYFFLGDFSARSGDSRLWTDGAVGHPAYAVPKSHLYGVVTHIFWPPSRWRTVRF